MVDDAAQPQRRRRLRLEDVLLELESDALREMKASLMERLARKAEAEVPTCTQNATKAPS